MFKPKDVDEYIGLFPSEVQPLIAQMRATIQNAAPKSEEVISYGMPAYKMNGILVYFAAYKNHIGFYPSGSGIATFKDQLSIYKGAKGSVQFPINKSLPLGLITKIVKHRVKENLVKSAKKRVKK